jgi:UDP-N-acetylmuramoyl-tripeptide--D-alanyl-D-alanine ligase
MIWVPMMLLELRKEHQYAVMELVQVIKVKLITHQIVQPHVAGILNIGTAHLGEFGGRDGICRAKSEIYRHILPQELRLFHNKMILPLRFVKQPSHQI